MSTALCQEALALPTGQLKIGESPNRFCFDLQAVAKNYAQLKSLHPEASIMPMVKAMGYGSSEVKMAKFFETLGVEIFGVAHPDEGVNLRRFGIKKDIFITHTPLYEMQKIVDADLQTALSDEESIFFLQDMAKKAGKILSVHLCVNTGMNRFGCPPEKTLPLALLIQKAENLVLEGICSHFPSADIPKQDLFTQKQIALYEEVCSDLFKVGIYPRYRHLANSGGSLRFKIPSCNLMRIGIALYGIYVSPACKTLPLQLAVSLTSQISMIKTITKGTPVSYGGRWQAPQDGTKIAIFPLGYHDGILRRYSKKGYVLVNGKKAPIVGAICMDNTFIDVTDIAEVQVGTPVLVFGETPQGILRPENFAKAGGSIPHELITQIGPRVPRVFV